MRRVLLAFLEALCRVLFSYEAAGARHVPPDGPAVVAANHPSYLDPVLLSLSVERKLRFMAWDKLFRVPILGGLMRAFGAFPVDVRPGRGREAFARAKALIESGEVIGLFPEGKRSRTGWLEPALREGAARLALETGAPLVPATIIGAFRAWPHYERMPTPARIKVRFHEPIDPASYRALPEEEGIAALLAELRRRVERTLLPGVKADLRMNVVYGRPAPWPRLHESLPPLVAALAVFWRTRSLLAVAPAYGYLAYLFADHYLLPQSRLIKWIRNASPLLFLLGYGPVVLGALGLPDLPAEQGLAAILAGALFPYLYERGRTALEFIRGLVLAALLEWGALLLAPLDAGPHLALPLFAAAFAWQRRTVYSTYTAPILLGYAIGVPWMLGARYGGVMPHAFAALLAWLLTVLLPYGPRASSGETESPKPLGLGLR